MQQGGWLIVWVVPASGLGLCVMVLVSMRAQGFQDAYQLVSVIVLPILLQVFGKVAGIMYFSVSVALLLGSVIWLINVLLLWLGSRSFKRGYLLALV